MKRWIWYVLAAVACLLAGGGVLYGVLTHKEPGLMLVCWKGGIARYDQNCEELQWKKNQIPLPYYIDFGKDHKVYTEAVVRAAHMWNQEIGPVFRRVNEKEDAIVIIMWGSYEGGQDCSDGHVKHWGYTGPKNVEVGLKNPSDMHTVFRMAAHEFGHVLGLAHDKHAIMQQSQEDMPRDLKFTLPSDHDKKLLRELYQ
jgi:hypothetical protein